MVPASRLRRLQTGFPDDSYATGNAGTVPRNEIIQIHRIYSNNTNNRHHTESPRSNLTALKRWNGHNAMINVIWRTQNALCDHS